MKSYLVLLVCPHMDRADWVTLESLYLSLEGVLNTEWEFNCPIHGVQHARPLQAETKENIRENCTAPHCRNGSIGIFQGEPFCRDHFILTCQNKLDTYYARFRERNWRDVSLEAVSHFIQDSLRLADAIDSDKIQRAQLLDVISSAADLGRHLRRSPRKAVKIPVKLSSEEAELWEEDTEVIMISRCGALVRTKHLAQIDQRLLVSKLDEQRKSRARVVWSSPKGGTNAAIAVEFLEAENFWGLNWRELETESLGQLGSSN
jgi:hypothetical protein